MQVQPPLVQVGAGELSLMRQGTCLMRVQQPLVLGLEQQVQLALWVGTQVV